MHIRHVISELHSLLTRISKTWQIKDPLPLDSSIAKVICFSSKCIITRNSRAPDALENPMLSRTRNSREPEALATWSSMHIPLLPRLATFIQRRGCGTRSWPSRTAQRRGCSTRSWPSRTAQSRGCSTRSWPSRTAQSRGCSPRSWPSRTAQSSPNCASVEVRAPEYI